MFVRILSESYGGIYTHWHRGRSLYCIGKDCPALIHKDFVWKGYCAAQWFNIANKKWIPMCLEITEHLELDMRGIFARGQVWELWREKQGDRKKTPVEGKLHEFHDPGSLPPAFDYMPCLKAVYHTSDIECIRASPIPARVYVAESDGPIPSMLVPTPQDRAGVPEGFSYAAEALKHAKDRKGPTEKKKA